ncbi:hypothetical protein A2U01_0116341, partial [Trifolium medium]|nr:hypothetical protein [Trifolium medium]
RARQQKLESDINKPDPLTQLIVEDETTKGGKRKKRTETGRISLEVPGKEGASNATAGGDVVEAEQSSP